MWWPLAMASGPESWLSGSGISFPSLSELESSRLSSPWLLSCSVHPFFLRVNPGRTSSDALALASTKQETWSKIAARRKVATFFGVMTSASVVLGSSKSTRVTEQASVDATTHLRVSAPPPPPPWTSLTVSRTEAMGEATTWPQKTMFPSKSITEIVPFLSPATIKERSTLAWKIKMDKNH